MPASFLHGVETIEVTKGARTIQTVKTAVIGIIGTAPIDEVDEQYRTINEPTLILNETEAVRYFGKSKAGFTIPDALDAMFDQGAGIAIVINVFNPEKHENVEDVKLSDIIGGVDALTGKRTGLKAFEDCYSLFGYYPKTIVAPVYCESAAIVPEINIICNKIRAIGLVDAPVGASVQDVITGRGSQGTINFNTSSDRIVLCYPHLKVYDSETDTIKLQPYSQRLAGVIAAKDIEKGYHWSPSNTEIQGIIGVERQLTSMINDPTSEVNTLNEAGVVTVFNSYGTGFRTWGNRSAAFPSSTLPTNFINVRRTADILHESVEYSMLQFIDYPIDNGLIDSICETVNQFIRTLIGRGALIDGKCSFNQDKNPTTELANGHLLFDIEFMPPTPAERITFESFIDIELLKSLGAS
ncbi:phage tail sheath subtilisin-like domain-containing protein [bacterium]|nr:phage tail sheath subtilisin-like domain-containing protein [bacterium]MBR1681518.1 phage tail sheath subtilisin-like domain-containing protein [bacterium]